MSQFDISGCIAYASQVQLTYTYRLLLTASRQRRLNRLLGMLCTLYNAALEERISAWRRGVSITKYDQYRSLTQIRKDNPIFAAYPVEVMRSALNRLDAGYQGFFRRIKASGTPGFPRFRPRRRYTSFSLYSAPMTDKAIWIKGLGKLRFKRHRPLPGPVKQIRFVKRDDIWQVQFICEVTETEPTGDYQPVGVDVGLTDVVTLSTGKRHRNRKATRKHAERLAQAQRALARKQRRSLNRRRARKAVNRAQRRIGNTRRTYLHQISRSLVREFTHIAVERPSMVAELIEKAVVDKEVSTKSIYDAAWGILFAQLTYKAACAGREIRGVEPRGTSQNCSACGVVVPKSLHTRWHWCSDCGLSLHRDINAARNILARADFEAGRSGPARQPVVAHEPQLQSN